VTADRRLFETCRERVIRDLVLWVGQTR
jgi:hypothetical protein